MPRSVQYHLEFHSRAQCTRNRHVLKIRYKIISMRIVNWSFFSHIFFSTHSIPRDNHFSVNFQFKTLFTKDKARIDSTKSCSFECDTAEIQNGQNTRNQIKNKRISVMKYFKRRRSKIHLIRLGFGLNDRNLKFQFSRKWQIAQRWKVVINTIGCNRSISKGKPTVERLICDPSSLIKVCVTVYLKTSYRLIYSKSHSN